MHSWWQNNENLDSRSRQTLRTQIAKKETRFFVFQLIPTAGFLVTGDYKLRVSPHDRYRYHSRYIGRIHSRIIRFQSKKIKKTFSASEFCSVPWDPGVASSIDPDVKTRAQEHVLRTEENVNIVLRENYVKYVRIQ